MKSLSKHLLVLALFSAMSLTSLSASAYCEWHHGQKVCGYHHNRAVHCRWVPAHWYHGHRVAARKVCYR